MTNGARSWRWRAFSNSAIDGAEGTDAFHWRGLEEKIWNVFAPNSAAFSAERSSEPAMEVWIPRCIRPSIVEDMPKRSSTTPNKVWKAFPEGAVKLNLRLLEVEEGEAAVPSVLIEGSRQSLRALASVINAVAEDEDCGYGISPTGPGNAYFSKKSRFGIYIHRLPCVNRRLSSKLPPSAVRGQSA